jgi:hypothetical protein
MRKTATDKVAASLTVYRVRDMTARGRRDICAWLLRLAQAIWREPESFAKTFRARYYYRAKKHTA